MIPLPHPAEIPLQRCGAFEIEFDRASAATTFSGEPAVLHLPVPWLGGEASERIFGETDASCEAAGFVLRQSGGLLLGCATQPVEASPQEAARTLYARLLTVSRGRQLYRIWNYVPSINGVRDGVENYRAFCAGRAEAFEGAYGPSFKRRLPAASAVGCGGDALAVVFAAGSIAPRHFENREQVPAYEYPHEHGPRAPSFSRATLATHAGQTLLFISGTAAIKGHATVAVGDLAGQLECSLDNLRIVSRAAGFGPALGAGSGCRRHFKVYVREACDYAVVRERLERDLIESGDRVVYLQADICRAALLVEIEATLIRG